MLPDRVSNPGPLTYESGSLPIGLRGPAKLKIVETANSVESDVRPLSHLDISCFLFSLRILNMKQLK